jgi:[ribosomal protein S5]-alanine N-acetyltransferase
MATKSNVIQLNGFSLRRWRQGDESSLSKHADDYDIWINVTDRFPNPYTVADAQEWILASTKNEQLRDFAIVVNDEAVGGIGFLPQKDVFRRSAEIGYWLGKQYWGRGFMTQAVTAVTEYAFKNVDLCRIYAGVFAWNPASAKVLEKCGYEFEGRLRNAITKDGKTTDQLLYSKVL